MGFKFKRFDYVGGATTSTYDWGGTSTDITRSQGVLKDMGNWLLQDSGLHWQLDSTRHSNYDSSVGIQTTDFYNVPVKNSSGSLISNVYYPGLFFTNSQSGCKLFLAIIGNPSRYIYCDSDFITGCYETNHLLCGVIASIIPESSTQNFGDFSTSSSFLPTQATRLIGTIHFSSYNGSNIPLIYCNYTSHNYLYSIIANDYCIGIGGNFSANTNVPVTRFRFFTGRILGTLANVETTPQSKYGCFSYVNNDTSNNNGEFYRAEPYFNAMSGSGMFSVNFFGVNCFEYSNSILYCSVFDAQGGVLNSKQYKRVNIFPDGAQKISSVNTQEAISGKQRWVPAAVCLASDDLSTYYVTLGDGFKGYLDTDLFRYAICDYGRTYGNGTFIGLWNNFLIGWDPSNTDSL